MSRKIITSLMLTILLAFTSIACGPSKEETIETLVPIQDTNISIVASGDVLMHMPQVDSGYDRVNKEYNFDEFFLYVKEYISQSDLALCNIETTLLDKPIKFTGYPKFNSPKEILDSLKDAGFDYVCTAHNHINDMGKVGFMDTSKNVLNANLGLLGTKVNSNDKNYQVVDLKGVKVGLTNFAFSTVDKNGYRYINGLPLDKELNNNINLFSFSNIDKDIKLMEETKENMIKDGAEFVIFYVHWGNEYQTLPSKEQEDLAKRLNSIGVDVILGSHPHVVQPIRKITNPDTQKETLVFYSLGNFVSNQSFETIGNAKSEDGLMVKLNITKTNEGKVSLSGYETVPTWVYKHKNPQGKTVYNIVPTTILDELENYDFTTEVINKLKNSKDSTTEIISN